MEETALRAIGRMAFPDMPPYVVRPSSPTDGQAVPFERKFISVDTVFVAVTPSALPVSYLKYFSFTLKSFNLKVKTVPS